MTENRGRRFLAAFKFRVAEVALRAEPSTAELA